MNFLLSANNVFKRHGKIIIQILNYNNPVIVPGFTLPKADTKRIEFNWEYVALEDSVIPGFKTSVKDKCSGKIITDIHQNHPFLSREIAKIAKSAGFINTRIFGNYDGKEAEVSDFFQLFVIPANPYWNIAWSKPKTVNRRNEEDYVLPIQSHALKKVNETKSEK